MTENVTVSGPEQVIASVPSLLGFAPSDSVVFVGLQGKRLVCTARIDRDGLESSTIVTDAFKRNGIDSTILLTYADTLKSATATAWEIAAEITDLTVSDSLAISEGKWLSVLCADIDCCPPAGKPLSTETSAFTVALAVFTGAAPVTSRDALQSELAQIAPDENADPIDVPKRDVAWREIDTHLGDSSALHDDWTYWSTVARTSTNETRAHACFLAAWSAWRVGDGARANVALEACLASDPDYSAGKLLRTVLLAGVDPREFPVLDGE